MSDPNESPSSSKQPRKALVRPRVMNPDNTGTLPLDSVVVRHASGQGILALTGEPGSGLSTALRYLDSALPPNLRLALVDQPTQNQVFETTRLCKLVIYAARTTMRIHHIATFKIAPWTESELNEYLAAAHPDQCDSVMRRARACVDAPKLEGRASAWRVTLDAMAEDETIVTAEAALIRFLDRHLPAELRDIAREACMNTLLITLVPLEQGASDKAHAELKEAWRPIRDEAPEDVACLLKHPYVQMLLAAEYANECLPLGKSRFCSAPLPEDLLRRVAWSVRENPESVRTLWNVLESDDRTAHSTAASLLHYADIGWHPKATSARDFNRAHFENVNWPGLSAVGANIREIHFDGANLSGGVFTGAWMNLATLRKTNLSGSNLTDAFAPKSICTEADFSNACAERAVFMEAQLGGCNFSHANLVQATFAGADLSRAFFAHANLKGAVLTGVTLHGTDFSYANLEGANLTALTLTHAILTGAVLRKANCTNSSMEGLELPDADFTRANLERALLTRSKIHNGHFNEARMVRAVLADVDWPGADLRDADLTAAVFHLGSTRASTALSPSGSIPRKPAHVTDVKDTRYKPMEVIRKANLQGADLRGAKVFDCDFYMVDLRDAQFDAKQRLHFQSCGAILDRVTEPRDRML